jgi:hypothetical protein
MNRSLPKNIIGEARGKDNVVLKTVYFDILGAKKRRHFGISFEWGKIFLESSAAGESYAHAWFKAGVAEHVAVFVRT